MREWLYAGFLWVMSLLPLPNALQPSIYQPVGYPHRLPLPVGQVFRNETECLAAVAVRLRGREPGLRRKLEFHLGELAARPASGERLDAAQASLAAAVRAAIVRRNGQWLVFRFAPVCGKRDTWMFFLVSALPGTERGHWMLHAEPSDDLYPHGSLISDSVVQPTGDLAFETLATPDSHRAAQLLWRNFLEDKPSAFRGWYYPALVLAAVGSAIALLGVTLTLER